MHIWSEVFNGFSSQLDSIAASALSLNSFYLFLYRDDMVLFFSLKSLLAEKMVGMEV